YFHYSFSPIANIIVIIVPTTAHKTPKSKKVAVCISIGFKITNGISKGVCVKKFLLYNQLAIGVAKQKNNPLPISLLNSQGYILPIVLISNATEMITSELDNNKPPTKPPPGVSCPVKNRGKPNITIKKKITIAEYWKIKLFFCLFNVSSSFIIWFVFITKFNHCINT